MSETREHAHRLRIEPASARVSVSVGDVVLAETTDAVELREGSLPVRYYLPESDVRMDLLSPNANRTHCPFKGDAAYWSYGDLPDIAWTYRDPIEGAKPIAGRIAFYNEKVDIDVDGTRLDRPRTQWS